MECQQEEVLIGGWECQQEKCGIVQIRSNHPLSKIPFCSLFLLAFLSLKPCSSFHRFRAEMSLRRLTSVVSGFSSSRLTQRMTFLAFWQLAGVSSSILACRAFILSWQAALRHCGTRYSGTNSESTTLMWSSFLRRSLMLLTSTSRSLLLLSNSDLSSGVRSSFFLKSNCWKRSALWLLMVLHTSLTLQRKPSSSALVMGSYLMVACSNFAFSQAISACSRAISGSVFSMKVMRKGLSWKCSKRRAKSFSRKPTPSVMMEVMLSSSNSLPLQAFLAFCRKTLFLRSLRTSLVAMRMLVAPFIQTDSTQKRRFMGFSELQTPTAGMWARSRKRAQRQTSRMLSTSTRILGLTSPNFRVTQRLMGRVSLSPTAQKWLICSSAFSAAAAAGGSQLIFTAFFIHSFLKRSISAEGAQAASLNPTRLQLMLPARSSRASPQPKLKRQSASGTTMATIRSFSFFQRLLTWSGLPTMMCLFSIAPTSCMYRFTIGTRLSADSRCWSRCDSSRECPSTTMIPSSSFMNFRNATSSSPISFPESSGAVTIRLCRSDSISSSCCWKSVGTVIFSFSRPRCTEGQSAKNEPIWIQGYITVVDWIIRYYNIDLQLAINIHRRPPFSPDERGRAHRHVQTI